jgi:uncharacterized integral membrane protein
MKLLYWLIVAPLMVLAVLFAVSNRDSVDLALWPLPWVIEAPVYAIALGALALGVVVGAFVAWIGGGRARGRARSAERKFHEQQRDVEALEKRIEEADMAEDQGADSR